jgi:hypothetical protein
MLGAGNFSRELPDLHMKYSFGPEEKSNASTRIQTGQTLLLGLDKLVALCMLAAGAGGQLASKLAVK